MPSAKVQNLIFPAVAYGHCELVLVVRDLPRVERRLGAEDVIEWSHPETPAGAKKDTEILGVTVRCADEPEYDLAFQERSEEHTSELQSLMRISYDVLCLKKQKKT